MVLPLITIAGITGLSATTTIIAAVLAFAGMLLGGPLVKFLVGLVVAFVLMSSGLLPPYMIVILFIGLILYFMGRTK